MKTGIKVGDIMTRNFVYAKPETNLIDCAREMVKKRIGGLIIKDGKKLVGILTERDILWAMIKKSRKELKNIKASDVATKKVITAKPSIDVYEAVSIMKRQNYRGLPVVVNGSIVGLLTLSDILRVQPALFDIDGELMQVREESDKVKRMRTPKTGGRRATEDLCEECGNYDLLYKTDNRLLCESCREEM